MKENFHLWYLIRTNIYVALNVAICLCHNLTTSTGYEGGSIDRMGQVKRVPLNNNFHTE